VPASSGSSVSSAAARAATRMYCASLIGKVTRIGSSCETVVSRVGSLCPTRFPTRTCAVPATPSTGDMIRQ
jgi:hypothetical protein